MPTMRRSVWCWSALAAALALAGCASTSERQQMPRLAGSTTSEGVAVPSGQSGGEGALVLTKAATDPRYGRTEKKPIKVAGLADSGPAAERVYLSALRGPNGEILEFARRGSCCHFKTANSDFGTGLLDVYEVSYPGLAEPILLYLNMYDPGEVLIPVGFTSGPSSEK